MTHCRLCRNPIDPERLDALPKTTLCLSCAKRTVAKRVCFMDYGHKTAPSLVQVDANDAEALRRANRAFRRRR